MISRKVYEKKSVNCPSSSKGFLHVIRHAAIVKNEAEKDSPEFGKVTLSLTDKFRTNKVDGAGRK